MDDAMRMVAEDLADTLHFSPQTGHIWLAGRRMVLMHAESVGLLRREVVDAVGQERARAAFTRQGYNAGTLDAELAAKIRPHNSLHDMFSVGPEMHALEGSVLSDQIAFDVNIETGQFYSEYIWHNSSECCAHVDIFGRGHVPAGWSQIGYASGYASTFLGRPIIYREIECIAMGHESCRIIGRPADAWPDVEQDRRYLRGAHGSLEGGGSEGLHLTDAKGAEQTLVGASAGFNIAFDMIRKVADTSALVLLLGETGVGKEMFARSVHALSSRNDKPLVSVNCATIPESLIEAELFGVEKGAFTGAVASKPGRFERADGGTLFLDEIGTLSLASQAKLLRVLQEGEIERVGGTHTRPVDVRVIAATNLDLREAVAEGLFREDLFYRLNVFPVRIPPLRERRADLPILMTHFLRKYSVRHGRAVPGFDEAAVSAILNYDWPGNIRELENIIERGVILGRVGEALHVHDLFSGDEQINDARYGLSADGRVLSTAYDDQPIDIAGLALAQGLSLADCERSIITAALAASNGNRSLAARTLGLTRAQFNYRLKMRASTGSLT
jgi:transcriptional regulator with GAF, ATPase, and Fis domain